MSDRPEANDTLAHDTAESRPARRRGHSGPATRHVARADADLLNLRST
jgi:hypothetical protein